MATARATATGCSLSKEFEDAMPTFHDFSTLLLNCDFSKWREMAKSLKVSDITVSTISDNLGDDNNRDKKAFLLILSSWREKALVRKEDRKANWRNLRNALADFDDITEQIDQIEEGWSEDAGSDDVCGCKKPLALRTKKDEKKTLFKICPLPRAKQCKNSHFAIANNLLSPKTSLKAAGPPERLRHVLLLKRNLKLANFTELAPHLIKEGLLTDDEYLDITQRNGVSPQQHFEIFVTKFLLQIRKCDIVQKFIAALKMEKNHTGHEELLKRIEVDETIMKAFETTTATKDLKKVAIKVKNKERKKMSTKKRSDEEQDGPSMKKRRVMKENN